MKKELINKILLKSINADFIKNNLFMDNLMSKYLCIIFEIGGETFYWNNLKNASIKELQTILNKLKNI